MRPPKLVVSRASFSVKLLPIISAAKVTGIISSSEESFDDAVENGIKRAPETLKNLKDASVQNQQVSVKDGEIGEYCVNLRITIVL
ncbi:MAG: dodecin domain-containing protein [Verrucomicrobiales bacterium]|jgi:flavin-binding protein dodecin|nr:dodecin domain-containing protein [Verrucomicrobiales bacterium]